MYRKLCFKKVKIRLFAILKYLKLMADVLLIPSVSVILVFTFLNYFGKIKRCFMFLKKMVLYVQREIKYEKDFGNLFYFMYVICLRLWKIRQI